MYVPCGGYLLSDMLTDDYVVLGRGGRCLSIEGCRDLCKSVESECQLHEVARHLDRKECLQQNYGKQHEETL
jgi:hypothetical protein